MSDFVCVGAVADLAPGQCREASAGGRSLALFNVGGEIRVLANRCSHRGGPLGQGYLDGDTIICPWHGWAFDTRTGQSQMGSEHDVRSFPVRVENDQIFVAIEERP